MNPSKQFRNKLVLRAHGRWNWLAIELIWSQPGLWCYSRFPVVRFQTKNGIKGWFERKCFGRKCFGRQAPSKHLLL